MYGSGSIAKLKTELVAIGSHAFIVTGKNSAKKSGILDRLTSLVSEGGIKWTLFNQVESDPDTEVVEAGVTEYKKCGADFIIALGGGSVLDAAKGISICAASSQPIVYFGSHTVPAVGIPLVAIPTTAGTGSEVSRYAVITDNAKKIKMLIGGESLVSRLAVLDPELTLTMPPSVTAYTGMDALTHAIEAYISVKAQPMTDSYALRAISMISGNLVKAVKNGQDKKARENMLMGQMYAGLAFSNSSTALVHAMSRPLGAHFHIPHGLANAMLLEAVMEFNYKNAPNRFPDVAKAFGIDVSNKTALEAGAAVVTCIKDIYDDTGLEKKMSAYGASESDLPRLVQDTEESPTTKNNPAIPNAEQIRAIYKRCL